MGRKAGFFKKRVAEVAGDDASVVVKREAELVEKSEEEAAAVAEDLAGVLKTPPNGMSEDRRFALRRRG